MKVSSSVALSFVGLALAGFGGQASAQSFTQGFNGTAVPTGWVTTNLSAANATGTPWTVGPAIVDENGDPAVNPYEGSGFAIVNYSSVGTGSATGVGTINNWLISPLITGMKNGDVFSFYTTTVPDSAYPDRLEFRLSTAGASTTVGTTTTSVGDFTTTLATVNPSLAGGGYPETWTKVSATVSGVTGAVSGRVAFRYYVTGGGIAGDNSNIIGVDSFSYTAAAVPEPATWAMTAAGLLGLAALRRARITAPQRQG